jgi:lipopolysaccharide/colanic/teichoic acid biosynthesis glycosyltransferase
MLKRIFDVMASLAGLILLSPLLVATMLAIRLESPGSPFFLQERVGLGGKRFRIIKFRTMRQTAPAEGPQITIGHDPRITPIGHRLRKFKLDELPQLINVLKGEMSLVGPRPEVPAYMARYTPEQQAIILSVRPGITDFAAIEFSDEADILARAPNPEAAYVRYVREQSLWLDLKLIARTLGRIVGL